VRLRGYYILYTADSKIAVTLSALRADSLLSPKSFLILILLEAVRLESNIVAESIRYKEKSEELIGYRTRYMTSRNRVPQ
jgi:hypothetical protein